MSITKLLILIFASNLHAAELTVSLESELPASKISLVSVYRLFERIEKVTPDAIQERSLVFKSLPHGVYSVVLWEAVPGWLPSPDFDLTITVGKENQTVVVTRNIQQYKLTYRLPNDLGKIIEERYSNGVMVPCRLQKIRKINTPTFGFRWLIMRRVDDEPYVYTMVADLAPGEYTLTIPTAASGEEFPLPPPRRAGWTPPVPLITLPISVSDKVIGEYDIGGCHVSIKSKESSLKK
jgi:hypothetical protein